jgi:hypothetical protein
VKCLDADIENTGHCWSNESFHPELQDSATLLNDTGHSLTYPISLHPSNQPKCTHAYVLSARGARRILLHLRYIPFAYSRPIDQALAWLVQSGEIQSYSVVPSVVVQRKIVGSDVVHGLGGEWRDGLIRGVFGSNDFRKDGSLGLLE